MGSGDGERYMNTQYPTLKKFVEEMNRRNQRLRVFSKSAEPEGVDEPLNAAEILVRACAQDQRSSSINFDVGNSPTFIYFSKGEIYAE